MHIPLPTHTQTNEPADISSGEN